MTGYSSLLRSLAFAQLPDFIKHYIAVNKFSPIGLVNSAAQFGSHLPERGFAGLFTLLEQPEAFTDYFAGCLITPAK